VPSPINHRRSDETVVDHGNLWYIAPTFKTSSPCKYGWIQILTVTSLGNIMKTASVASIILSAALAVMPLTGHSQTQGGGSGAGGTGTGAGGGAGGTGAGAGGGGAAGGGAGAGAARLPRRGRKGHGRGVLPQE
jgi:hypothetical protein